MEHPKSEVSQPESPLAIIDPTLEPPSPRRKLIVTTKLPHGLISIKYITEETKTPFSHLPIVKLLTQEFLSILLNLTLGILQL